MHLRKRSFCWCENEIALKTNHEIARSEKFNNTSHSVIPQLLEFLESWEKHSEVLALSAWYVFIFCDVVSVKCLKTVSKM